MAQPTTRDRIVEALKDLPDDATFQDAIERLVFLVKIDIGLAELDAGKGIPMEPARQAVCAIMSLRRAAHSAHCEHHDWFECNQR